MRSESMLSDTRSRVRVCSPSSSDSNSSFSSPVATVCFVALPSRKAFRYSGAPEEKGLKETMALRALKRMEKPLFGQ